MSIEAKVDFSSALAGLERLAGEARVSLARSMAVAGGQVFRDEAKLRAPVETGRLRDSIYLAFRDGKSTDQQVMYSVTWNSKKAPHGHLLEFGHWQPYKVVRKPDGSYVSVKSQPLPAPKWVPARPFLRPALDAAMSRAREAMLKRGSERLAELLRGGGEE